MYTHDTGLQMSFSRNENLEHADSVQIIGRLI